MIHSNAFVHDHAVTGTNVTIGPGTHIWQFASVIREANIGENCSIASNVIVDGARIGDRCIIGHGCAINPGVVIHDDVFIGPGTIFCNDNWPSVSKDGFDLEALLKCEIVTAIVEDNAVIGARVLILPGKRIGAGAIVGGGIVVDRDVPPGCILWRNGTISPIQEGEHKRMVAVSG